MTAETVVPLAEAPGRTAGRRTAIATVCLSGTLEDKLVAAAAAGFDGVEIFEPDFVASSWSATELRARCADLGLSIDLYQPFRDFDADDPDVLAANLRRAERKFDVMEQLGTDLVLVCSSVSPHALDDDDRIAEQLHQLAARAAERGLRVSYEALAWGRFVNTYERSWDIVRRADHAALGLCVDSFHILSRGSDPAGIADIPGEKLFFLQLADAPALFVPELEARDVDLRDRDGHEVLALAARRALHRVDPGGPSAFVPGLGREERRRRRRECWIGDHGVERRARDRQPLAEIRQAREVGADGVPECRIDPVMAEGGEPGLTSVTPSTWAAYSTVGVEPRLTSSTLIPCCLIRCARETMSRPSSRPAFSSSSVREPPKTAPR